MLYAIVAVVVIIVDQAVKYWVAGNIVGNTVKTLIPGIVSLVNLHNDGAAFSFLSGGGARIYFIILTGVFTVAVIIALATNFISGSFGRWCIVLVTAGGLSNCIDRVIYGYVQDMFKIDLFDFAIFNVADIFITVFCILFILYILFGGEKDKDDDDEDYDDDEYDDDEDERRPLFKGMKDKADSFSKNDRKSHRSKYEEEYEQYKASHASRQQDAYYAQPTYSSPSYPVGNAPSAAPSDPFAAWERANARAESQQNSSYAARAMGNSNNGQLYNGANAGYVPQDNNAARGYNSPSAPSYQPQRPEAPAYQPQQPVAPAAPSYQPQQSPDSSYRPQQPVAPSAPQKSSSDFSIDDILAEFK